MTHVPAAECFTDSEFRERALLQTWFSPSFPIGGFAYSQGLESAAAAGFVKDETALLGWLGDLIEAGAISNDLILAACAWRTACARNWSGLDEVADLAAALQPSAERRLNLRLKVRAFLKRCLRRGDPKS